MKQVLASPKQSSSTAHTIAFIELQAYAGTEPGGSAQGLPLFFDKYKEDPEDPDYVAWGTATDVIEVFDPHFRNCVFGVNGSGEVISARFDHYRNAYVFVGSYGLTRRCVTDDELPLDGSGVDATIECNDKDGESIGALNIQLHYHGNAQDPIPPGTSCEAFYVSSERKWYTSVYHKNEEAPP